MTSKISLRKHFRAIRHAISAAHREEAALAAAKLLTGLPVFKSSSHIACYLPTDDEFDTSPLIEAIWQANKNCYLPVLCNEKDKHLQFVTYQYGDSLKRNKYKILEPSNLSHKIDASALDLVITPLLAFDLHGHRLGTGGGYYDRTFAFLHESASHETRTTTNTRKPLMLGLGYAAQQAENIPVEEWDVKLDGVLTERDCLAF